MQSPPPIPPYQTVEGSQKDTKKRACKGKSSYPSISGSFVKQETLVSLLRSQLEVPGELLSCRHGRKCREVPTACNAQQQKHFFLNSRSKEQIFEQITYSCDTNFFKSVCYQNNRNTSNCYRLRSSHPLLRCNEGIDSDF